MTVAEPPRVGVAVLITNRDRVLLVKRRNVHGAGSWSAVGGHLDCGESREHCAIREAKEETTLDITNVRFRAVTNDLFTAEGRHYLTLWFEAAYRSVNR